MSQPSNKENSSPGMDFTAPVGYVVNNHEGEAKSYQHNIITQSFQIGAEKITEFFTTVWRQIQGNTHDKSNTKIQLVEQRERIFVAEIIQEKLRNNEKIDELIPYFQLQQNERFHENNNQLKLQELHQQERTSNELHELIREGNQTDRERLQDEKASQLQNFKFELARAEREEEIISVQKKANKIQQETNKIKKEYYDKHLDYLVQWKNEQIQHQQKQYQVNWDIQNWQSILSPEDTKRFFQECQNKNEVSVLWSPPRIDSSSPFNLHNLKEDIRYHLQAFLQKNYNENSNCIANSYNIFRSSLEDMEARKLAKDLQPHCAIIIHSSITDKNVYLRITFAGEHIPIPPWCWKEFKEKLEKAGKSSDEAVDIVRDFIVIFYKILSGSFVDLYYLSINEFHEPRLSAIKSEIVQLPFEQYFENYLTGLTKIHNQISANNYNKFGKECLSNEKYPIALSAFEKAINLHPNFFEAWNNKGKTQCCLTTYEEAIQSYKKTIELKPNFFVPWQNKGFAESKLALYEEAIQSYKKAIELYPNFPETGYCHANALLKLTLNESNIGLCNDIVARVDEAIAIHKKASQNKLELSKDIRQEFLLDLYEISNLLFKQRDFNSVLKIYKELAKNEADLSAFISQRNLVIFWRRRGRILFKCKNYQSSVDSYIEAIKLKPQNHKLWLLKGIADFHNGSILDSLSSVTKAMALRPYFYRKRATKKIFFVINSAIYVIQQIIVNFKELFKLLKEY